MSLGDVKKNTPEVALNIFSIVDRELGRMHDLAKFFAEKEANAVRTSTHFSYNPSDSQQILQRIMRFQDIILAAAVGSDREIQKIIAELALTGDPNDPR